jgi:hypothetical protein
MTVTPQDLPRSWGSQHLSGTFANRPTAPDCLPGGFVFYFATDTGELSMYTVATPALGSTIATGAWTPYVAAGARPSMSASKTIGANFNAANGTDIITFTPTLPAGFTRWAINRMFITNASHTMATVSVGVYSAASAGGTAVITAYTPGNTNSTDGTAHNFSIASAASTFGQTACFAAGDSNYVNLVTQEGAACTADVTIEYILLP